MSILVDIMLTRYLLCEAGGGRCATGGGGTPGASGCGSERARFAGASYASECNGGNYLFCEADGGTRGATQCGRHAPHYLSARTALHSGVKHTKGAFLAWRRAHWPIFDAFMRDDAATWRRLTDQELAREEFFSELAVFCIFCRALMIHVRGGYFYCPYHYAGVHGRARRSNT